MGNPSLRLSEVLCLLKYIHTIMLFEIRQPFEAFQCNILALLKSMGLHIGINSVNDPQHEIPNNVVCATSKCADQPAHMRSLIRAFPFRLNIM